MGVCGHEHGHADTSGDIGIDAFILISPHCCIQLSTGITAGEAALAEAYLHRERPLGWIRWPGDGTRNLLQERGDRLVQEKLLREGRVWIEAGGPPTPVAHPSHASPAPSAGKNNAEPLLFARRDAAPPVLLPSPDSLHVFISSATSAEGEKSRAFPRHRRENNPYFCIPAFP